jgi:hypothetical protein
VSWRSWRLRGPGERLWSASLSESVTSRQIIRRRRRRRAGGGKTKSTDSDGVS